MFENVNACFLKGWRTLAAAGSIAAVGLLSVVGSLDLTPLVALFVQDQKYLGVAMLAVGALFAGLRYLTSSAVCTNGKPQAVDYANSDACTKHGIDDGE